MERDTSLATRWSSNFEKTEFESRFVWKLWFLNSQSANVCIFAITEGWDSVSTQASWNALCILPKLMIRSIVVKNGHFFMFCDFFRVPNGVENSRDIVLSNYFLFERYRLRGWLWLDRKSCFLGHYCLTPLALIFSHSWTEWIVYHCWVYNEKTAASDCFLSSVISLIRVETSSSMCFHKWAWTMWNYRGDSLSFKAKYSNLFLTSLFRFTSLGQILNMWLGSPQLKHSNWEDWSNWTLGILLTWSSCFPEGFTVSRCLPNNHAQRRWCHMHLIWDCLVWHLRYCP